MAASTRPELLRDALRGLELWRALGHGQKVMVRTWEPRTPEEVGLQSRHKRGVVAAHPRTRCGLWQPVGTRGCG